MHELRLDPGLKKNHHRRHSWDSENNLNMDLISDHITELLLLSVGNCLSELVIETSKF